MTGRCDDTAARDLVRRSFAAADDAIGFDVEAGLNDVLHRAVSVRSADPLPTPRPRPDPDPIPPSMLYYRHNGVTVTSHVFSDGRHRFEIAHLADVAIARGSIHAGAVAAAVVAAAEAVVFVPLVGMVGAIGLLAGVFAILIPCLVAVVCARRWSAQHELLALYRGQDVKLYGSWNELEFCQISRAVRRAMETADHRDGAATIGDGYPDLDQETSTRLA